MEDINKYVNGLRHEFAQTSLSETDVDSNPIVQFEKWFKQAVDSKVNEPNAMTVCTVNKDGLPSARIVLLRNFNETGFVFYTNYNSRKGREIAKNKACCFLFFWPELERQVRIEGILKKQTKEESDAYFNSRPRGSKLGAWTSEQSAVVDSREALDKAYLEMDEKFEGEEVPRPEHWGGYVLEPNTIEFWQGRPSRLHDRLLFTKLADEWTTERLAP